MSRTLRSPNSSTPFGRASRPALRLFGLLALVLLLGWSASIASAEEAAEEKKGSDLAIEQIDAFIAANPVNKQVIGWRVHLKKPPLLKFDPKKTYTWKLETSVGEVRFKLLDKVAPMHVSSTIYLTRLGYYNNLKFHRVIAGFMAQGGDPQGNGRGGPGYKYDGEFDDAVVHDSGGKLSMANSGPGTDGSQFFITFKATPHLDGKHTIFGEAEPGESMKTIEKMEALGRQGRGPSTPLEPILIKSATILIE
jgi:cyclophilin family peptidyl-prolyl cis-trans isomerase